MFFVFVSARTQHRLTACGQHLFEQSENIVKYLRTQNDVTPYCANDVMLRINDITANAVNDVASPTVLHFGQTDYFAPDCNYGLYVL